MPLFRKRPYPTASPPPLHELAAASSAADPYKAVVFVIPFTGEIFKTYPEYISRYTFYMQKVWQCETTATKGLTYPQALESERRAAKTIEGRFPEALKAQALQLVNFSTLPLADVVEDLYNTFALNYQPGEFVGCQIDGFVYSARCIGRLRTAVPKDDPRADVPEDPRATTYWVQLLDGDNKPAEDMTREVGVESLSRDRTHFSRVILRNFVRSAATKDPNHGSPWIVKPRIAKRYGISTVAPEHLRHLVGDQHKNKKRKQQDDDRNVSESREISPSVRKRTMAEAKGAEQRRRKETPAVSKAAVIRYPVEDLGLHQARAGISPTAEENRHADDRRPVPRKDFLVCSALADKLLTVWSFLTMFGTPLGLYPFSLDDFECALLHATSVPRCALIIEVVACLLNAVIAERVDMATDVPDSESPPAGVAATLVRERFEGPDQTQEFLAWRSAEVLGRGWDTRRLSIPDRQGWGAALLGCLVDSLLFRSKAAADSVEETLIKLVQPRDQGNCTPTGSTAEGEFLGAAVEDAFWSLAVEDKLAILMFLVDLVVRSSSVRKYMDESVEALANVRREITELKREVKRVQLARAEFDKAQAGEQIDGAKQPEENQKDTLRDEALTMEEVEDGNLSRHEKLKRKAEYRRLEAERRAREVAVERKAANAARARAADRRKFDDDEARLVRQIQQKSQEELRYAVHRLASLGRDRHHAQYWYLDDVGALAGCIGAGRLPYGGGRLFVQEAAPGEPPLGMCGARRPPAAVNETGERPGPSWGFYAEPEELKSLHDWLNPKGERELALRNALELVMPAVLSAMAERTQYLQAKELGTARPMRVTRQSGAAASFAEPYLGYTNKIAN